MADRGRPKLPLKHGTISAYNNRGCRCDRCRAALAQYKREHRYAEHARPVRQDDSFRHGTTNGYQYHKCRCDECVTYYRKYAREYMQKHRDKLKLEKLTTGDLREKNGKLYRRHDGRWRLIVRSSCNFCGKEIIALKARGGNHHSGREERYCDTTCYNRDRWAGHGTMVPIKCVICKRLKLVRKVHKERYKTCGRPVCVRMVKRRNALRRHRENGFARVQKV